MADIIKFPHQQDEMNKRGVYSTNLPQSDLRIIATGGGGIWYADGNCPKCNGTGKSGIEDCTCIRVMVANPFERDE